METHKNEGAPSALPEPDQGEGGANGTSSHAGEAEPGRSPVARSGQDKEKGRRGPAQAQVVANNTRRLRMERMMSKAELARRAGVSILTIDRVERGMKCRMDTKRKIIEALGLRPEDRAMVFAEDE